MSEVVGLVVSPGKEISVLICSGKYQRRLIEGSRSIPVGAQRHSFELPEAVRPDDRSGNNHAVCSIQHLTNERGHRFHGHASR